MAQETDPDFSLWTFRLAFLEANLASRTNDPKLIHMKLTAIVPAAGLGKRFDPTVRKTMVMVKGSPLLIHTLMRLHKSKLVSEIIPVLNEEDMEEWISIIDSMVHILIRIFSD